MKSLLKHAAAVFALLLPATALGNEYYPREAGSWGGVVRGGPGTNYRRIDGLQNGDPVILLENTGVMFNGYPWFRIRFKGGRTGYKWGGILCGFDGPLPGLYRTCTNDNRSATRNPPRDNTGDFPVAAATGGGIVRAGPGINYRRLTSLPQFEPITVISNTGVMFNGYPWFEIRYRGGRRGFQWGGIICSTERPFQGTFDTCANFRRSLAGNNNNPGNNESSRNTARLSCEEGLPLHVTFIDQGGQSYALFTFDGGPEIRVESKRTGSGFRYSNGFHELRGKGRSIRYSENGRLIAACRSR